MNPSVSSLKEALELDHSKYNTLQISAWINGDQSRFDLLMDIFLGTDSLLAVRSAQVVCVCGETHPFLFQPWVGRVLGHLVTSNTVAVRRAILRSLQFVIIPDDYLGTATDLFFKILSSSGEAISVKVYAMTLLSKISNDIPELKPELRLHLIRLQETKTPAIISRSKRIMARL